MADPSFAQATTARNATSAGGNDFSGSGYKKNVMHQTGGVDDFASGSQGFVQMQTGGASRGAGSGFSYDAVKFPLNLGTDPTQMNLMMFTTMEITGGKADTRTLEFRTMADVPKIALPIPSGLNTSYAQGWGKTEVPGYTAQMVGSDTGQDLVKGIADTIRVGSGGLFGGGEALGNSPAQTINKTIGALGDTWQPTGRKKDEATGKLESWGSYFSSMLGNANQGAGGMVVEGLGMAAAGPLSGIAEAAQFTAGMRAVNQAIMSYSGPGFRNFTYSFSFKPFSKDESEAVTEIIRIFKTYSAPHQFEANDYSRVYNLPAVFKIHFLHGMTEHKHIAKVGHCALTNIGVSYGGSKFSTFSKTHAPVQVDVTLAFQELELLNRQMMETEQYGGVWPRQSSSSAGLYSSDF